MAQRSADRVFEATRQMGLHSYLCIVLETAVVEAAVVEAAVVGLD